MRRDASDLNAVMQWLKMDVQVSQLQVNIIEGQEFIAKYFDFLFNKLILFSYRTRLKMFYKL